MTLTTNKEELEKLFFAAYTSDRNLVSLLGNRFNPKLFNDHNFQVVSNLYYQFFKKFDKLPTAQEIGLFTANNEFKICYQSAIDKISNVKIDTVDKSIFYNELEQHIKERSSLLTVHDIVDSYSRKDKNALEPSNLVSKFEDIAGISLWDAHVFDAQEDVLAYFDEVTNASKRLPTGYKEIDEKINGGIFADGKFIGVIFAETNMGKSIMLTNLATNAVRQGKNVLIISLEMSEIVYATRAYADLYSLPIKNIHFMKDELVDRIKTHPEYGKLYIKEFPPSTMTVDQIGGFIENLVSQGFEFGLCCIDYLTLLTSANASDNSNEVGKEITRKLRALTYKFNFPIMTAAQLNRDGFDSVPSNKNAAESIAIPQEADWCIGLYQQKEDKEQHIMRVRCMKSRLGQNDWSINLKYNTEYLRFEDLQPGQMQQTQQQEETKSNDELDNVNDILDIMDIGV